MIARQKKQRVICTGLLIVWLLGAVSVDPVGAADWRKVKWVDDGDTILLTDGRRIRYIGINTPEIDHAEYDRKAEPLAYEALAYNRRLVYRKRIRLEFDTEKQDRYGRWLAYVFLPEGRFVNRSILETGLAYVLPRHPNTTYASEFLSAQRKAMSARRGIWRRAGLTKAERCWGNSRTRRFHRPSCPFAHRISANHRVVFSNRWDAFWAGYAPAKGCMSPGGGR